VLFWITCVVGVFCGFYAWPKFTIPLYTAQIFVLNVDFILQFTCWRDGPRVRRVPSCCG